jgi:hypothetical protein
MGVTERERSTRRNTNAAQAAAVPAVLARMAPVGAAREKKRAPRCTAGPVEWLERRGFFEAQSKL